MGFPLFPDQRGAHVRIAQLRIPHPASAPSIVVKQSQGASGRRVERMKSLQKNQLNGSHFPGECLPSNSIRSLLHDANTRPYTQREKGTIIY